MRNLKESAHRCNGTGAHVGDGAAVTFSHDAGDVCECCGAGLDFNDTGTIRDVVNGRDMTLGEYRRRFRVCGPECRREQYFNETRVCQQCGMTVRRGDMAAERGAFDAGFCSRKCESEYLYDWEKALRFNNPRPYLEKIGVPARYCTCTEENFAPASDSQKRAAKILREWVPTGDGTGIFLTGRPGIGKTHLATAWLRRMLIANPQHRFKFQPVAELFRQLRKSFDHGSNLTESGITDELIRVGVLVLDDLGTERTSAYVLDSLYVILDGRYSAMRSTIITSNLTLSEIAERYDPRLASRVAEGLVVKLDGPDYRLANSKSKGVGKNDIHQ